MAFGEDDAGNVYVLTNETFDVTQEDTGGVHRIVSAGEEE